MADASGVMAIVEVTEGQLAPISAELLTAARNLADSLGESVSALVIGSDVGAAGAECAAYGADKVYVADSPLLAHFQSDAYTSVAADVCAQETPSILLLGQTMIGRDLAPRLAFRLETGVTMDCVALDIDPDSKLLLATKPVYGGNANAVMVCEEARPQMATLRAKAIDAAAADASRQADVVAVSVGIDDAGIKTRFQERVRLEFEGVRLEDAPVVVTGGRGMGSEEAFHHLNELAGLMDGAVGGSKAAVDMGWLPPTEQVGLTGKMVSPDIYIAVGVSGAIQHMAGCSGAKTIVAINKDPEADIFRYAQYGVVADWKNALPTLIEKIREIKASARA
jgi:electron transfer flavoprotein alpha subunit